jgi:hypothetical protein
MKSDSKNPLVLGLQEIFNDIDSPEGIEKERLATSLEKRIFPVLNVSKHKPVSLDGKENISDFIEYCFGQ